MTGPDAMRAPAISALDFARQYAERGGETVRQMALSIGHMREVRPCDCDYENCQGWQMANPTLREPWEAPGISLIDLALDDESESTRG